MACIYLLTLGDQPSAPQLERSYMPKQWAKRCTNNTIGVLLEEGHPSSSLKPTPSVLPPKESDELDKLPSEGNSPHYDVILLNFQEAVLCLPKWIHWLVSEGTGFLLEDAAHSGIYISSLSPVLLSLRSPHRFWDL